MPRLAQNLDAEQAQFDSAVKKTEDSWISPRQAHIKRSANTMALLQHEADFQSNIVHTQPKE
jgi:hypothetical protein